MKNIEKPDQTYYSNECVNFDLKKFDSKKGTHSNIFVSPKSNIVIDNDVSIQTRS